jgi:hypothetical protein
MSTFESFSHSFYEIRRVLRDRLRRMLRPAHEQLAAQRGDDFDLSDVDMLDVLLRVRITHDDDVTEVRAAYEARRAAEPTSPTWERLLDEGWFGETWGRITTELHTRSAARQQAPELLNALAVILDRSHHKIRCEIDDISSLSPAGQQVATRLVEHHHERCPSLSVPSPDWVAARLWEKRPMGDDGAALRWWVDRWRLLGKRIGPPNAMVDEGGRQRMEKRGIRRPSDRSRPRWMGSREGAHRRTTP